MEKHIYNEQTGISYTVIITCPTLPFPMKKNSLSAYGGSDTCDILSNTARFYILIC